jgi:hypothetical protein
MCSTCHAKEAIEVTIMKISGIAGNKRGINAIASSIVPVLCIIQSIVHLVSTYQ